MVRHPVRFAGALTIRQPRRIGIQSRAPQVRELLQVTGLDHQATRWWPAIMIEAEAAEACRHRD